MSLPIHGLTFHRCSTTVIYFLLVLDPQDFAAFFRSLTTNCNNDVLCFCRLVLAQARAQSPQFERDILYNLHISAIRAAHAGICCLH